MDDVDYKVRLDVFEGPLDLLLYLIKKEEIDISTISLEKITTQYLQYIEMFKLLNIDLASEFIVMAAHLMYLKSCTLLPKVEPLNEEESESDPRWELIRQLIEYKKFKDAAGYLEVKAMEREHYFPLIPEKMRREVENALEPLPDINIFDLLRGFQNVLKRFEESNDWGEIVDDNYTVADKIEFLLLEVKPGERLKFTSLFEKATSKLEMIVTFLAILELMKINRFQIVQPVLLGEIEIWNKTREG